MGISLYFRRARVSSKPFIPGIMMSRMAMSGACSRARHQGGGAVLRLQHPEAVSLQVQPQQGADVRVVLGNENQWLQAGVLLYRK